MIVFVLYRTLFDNTLDIGPSLPWLIVTQS